MTDKEFHRDAFILGAIIIIALLLWLWLNKGGAGAVNNVNNVTNVGGSLPNIVGAPGNTFNVPGSVSNYGPVTFPQAVYNFPVLEDPQYINYPGNPVASATAANCMCGCDGAGGTTTYVLQPPDFSSIYNTLASSVSSTAQALLNAEYNAMGYTQGVFVSNATPTPFAGGTFGA